MNEVIRLAQRQTMLERLRDNLNRKVKGNRLDLWRACEKETGIRIGMNVLHKDRSVDQYGSPDWRLVTGFIMSGDKIFISWRQQFGGGAMEFADVGEVREDRATWEMYSNLIGNVPRDWYNEEIE